MSTCAHCGFTAEEERANALTQPNPRRQVAKEPPFTADEHGAVTFLSGRLPWKHERLIECLLRGAGYPVFSQGILPLDFDLLEKSWEKWRGPVLLKCRVTPTSLPAILDEKRPLTSICIETSHYFLQHRREQFQYRPKTQEA